MKLKIGDMIDVEWNRRKKKVTFKKDAVDVTRNLPSGAQIRTYDSYGNYLTSYIIITPPFASSRQKGPRPGYVHALRRGYSVFDNWIGIIKFRIEYLPLNTQ